ncbi:hypothetical protein SAMN05660209_00596 [Geodermatophilus africanus]|uniref:Uncharacterized protein n=1 Tax=Geodermatophilus africanus TaxID=1137993 RepID=A0A1H3CF00_9ACTN|nr:hypothetical protein [Geodermatophilus africanus]SDX52478.1 hypothetical protein SAMN05660209_00596 [Geodermatophilus africanus]
MTAVVRLGAECDLTRESGPELSFGVTEFADLADGRRLVLRADRGFTSRLHGPGADESGAAWRHETLAGLAADVLATVLPDDAEETGEDHPWRELAGLLRARGVAVSTAELRRVPYVVELSDRVRARLPPAP